jgi:type II secretory pathway pseudopilin PulG
MYKILGADQKEYGPITADTLRQWIAERRANGQTMICLDGTTDWKTLASFPEFSDALTRAFGATATTGATGAPQVVAGVEGQKKGLAITSLVLGILSVAACLIFVTGIPAIVTGVMALNRARRQPTEYGGKRLATAGIALGAAGIMLTVVVAIVAGMMLPALAKAKSRAQSISCINNLKQIALGARIYANDNKGAFPADFEAMKNELSTPKILCCPGDGSKTRAESWAGFGPNNVTYIWMGAGINEEKLNPNQVIARCPIHENTANADGSAHMGRRR